MMVDEERLDRLCSDLKKVNDLLDKIQDERVEDLRWEDAMTEINSGFAEAVMWIAEEKGLELPPVVGPKEINRILEV